MLESNVFDLKLFETIPDGGWMVGNSDNKANSVQI
jgi:hypothetical protein